MCPSGMTSGDYSSTPSDCHTGSTDPAFSAWWSLAFLILPFGMVVYCIERSRCNNGQIHNYDRPLGQALTGSYLTRTET